MQTLSRVQKVIAEALYVDLEEVTPQASLMNDLGAESIDFLDIMFRLEKEFAVKMPKGEIERRARGGLADAEFAVDGTLTDKALARIRDQMPEVSAEALKPGLLLRDVPSLFTVTTFARMVEAQLLGGEAAARTPTAEGDKGAGTQI